MSKSGGALSHDPGFQRYYERHLQPIEAQYEQYRVVARGERNKRLIGACLGWGTALALVLFWLRPQAEVGWWMLVVVMLLLAVALAVWSWSPVLAHIGRVKEQVLPRMIPYFGGFRYEWDPELSLARYSSFHVLPRFNKHSTEDLIEGVHLGVPLKACEIALREERRSSRTDGSSSTTTHKVFDGMLVEMTVGAKFPGTTVIGTEGLFTDYFEISDEAGLETVSQAQGFEVHATATAAEVSVATDRVVRELGAIAKRFEAKQLVCSFQGDQVVMLIAHEGDFFEIASGEKTDFVRDAGQIKSQIDKIFEVVERLGFPGPEDHPKAAPASPSNGLPELEIEADESRYDVGGWGCLGTLAAWIAATAAYGLLLEPRVEPTALLPWSAGGGLLLAAGLFRLARAFGSKQVGAFLLALMLLAGAAWVLYRHWNPAPEPAGARVQAQETRPPPVAQLPDLPSALPVGDWLEPAGSSSDILRSSIEAESTEFRHGETAVIVIRLANNSSDELSLNVEAELNSLAYLVDVSHGGKLISANTESSRTVAWPKLTLPGRRVGVLKLQILVEARYYSDVVVEVSASDRVHNYEERLRLERPHDYADGSGSDGYWFVGVMAGLMVAILVGFIGRRLDRNSLARQIMTRSALGFIALLLLTLGGLMGWTLMSPYLNYVPTHCQILDARFDESPMVAARYDTPAGQQISTGYAGGAAGGSIDDLQGLDRGVEIECWHHKDIPERVTTGHGLDWALLTFTLVFAALGGGLGWLAVRRKGIPET